MKDKVFKYKGQLGSVEPDLSRGYLYGKLLYINDLVTFEAATIPELEKEFRAAVDEYLEDCADLGVEPNKPFKGSFNVRVGPDLHKKIVFKASDLGISVNDAVTRAVSEYVNESSRKKLMDDVREEIQQHVYHAGLYASDAWELSLVKRSAAARRWSEPFEGLKGRYQVVAGRAHEH